MFEILIFIISSLLFLIINVRSRKLEKRKKSLANKVVLITGSGNGLGRALCLAFAREKCHIICVDIDENGNNETVRQIKEVSNSIRVLNYTCDITNIEQVNILEKNVFAEFNTGVDILINNAAFISYNLYSDENLSTISNMFNVNLTSHFSLIHAFLPNMIKENNGHIVCISSIAGHVPIEGCIAYCATKRGTIGLMEGLSLELRLMKSSVKTLTVFPGMMGTQLLPKFMQKPGTYWLKCLPLVVLDVNYVAKNIINSIKEEKRFYYTHFDYHVISYLLRVLPIFITDWVEEKFFLGITRINTYLPQKVVNKI